MRLRAAVWACVFALCLSSFACERQGQKAIVCRDFEQSQASILRFIAEIARQIDQNTDPAVVLKVVTDTFKRDGANIERCTSVIDEQLRVMTSSEVRQYHDAFIVKAEVLKLLDAQDKFQERASADQIEVIDDFLSKVFLLSE